MNLITLIEYYMHFILLYIEFTFFQLLYFYFIENIIYKVDWTILYKSL